MPTQTTRSLTFVTDELRLDSDGWSSPFGSHRLSDIPDRYPLRKASLTTAATPVLRKLFRAALYDVESNIAYADDWRYFSAGARGGGWNGRIFVRDVTFAGLLGLHEFYPEVMRDSYAYMRDRVCAVGRKNPACHKMEGYDDEIVAETFAVFKDSGWNINPFARCTDGMCMIWGMWDLLKKTGGSPQEIDEVYAFGVGIYGELFAPLQDTADGLYRGQSSFVDIGLNGYPESFGRNPPGTSDADSARIYNRALRIKATSTNCIYVLAFRALAEMAERLNRPDDAVAWRDRRDRLAAAIRDELQFPDGTFSYFKHEDGRLEPRQHALATAFAVLSGTVTGAAASAAICDYPVTARGVPLHDPFFPNDQGYHNNASWPFADAFFLWAREEATGKDETSRHFALLATAFQNGSFHERVSHLSNFIGGEAQLWSAAPFLGRCRRAGLVAGVESTD